MLGLGSGINRLSAAEAAAIAGRIPGFTGLLDESYGASAEAAYSVRRLTNRVSAAMTIRRDSDSTETDIGFDSNGNLDEAAITAFCTGTTCRVASWKDQSGNDNHAVQAVAASQPTIYTGGALVKENGKVALDFDGSNDELETTATFSLTQPAHQFGTGRINASYGTSTNYTFASSDVATNRNHFFYRSTGEYAMYSGSSIEGTIGTNSSQFVFSALFNSPSSALYLNGSSVASGDSGSYNFGGNLLLGNQSGNFPWYGVQQEFILYDSDKSGTDQTSIESNIGGYFTQNTPLLDTYTGAAAAYSLRKLSSSYSGPAIRVRRDNDNLETDINFNVFGELDTVSLAAHCGSNNGYVTNWYDQSSNSNTARQTTAANQPKIYDGTTGVVTENGKPAVLNSGGLHELTLSSSISNATNLASVAKANTTGWNMLIGQSYDGGFRTRNDGKWYPSASSTANEFQYQGGIAINGTELTTATAAQSQQLIFSTAISGGYPYALLQLGGTYANRHWNGPIQELILWSSDQSSNRTGIETNINTFYNAY